MTLLAPWDPNYEAKAGSQLVWVSRGTCGSGLGVGQGYPGRRLKLQ